MQVGLQLRGLRCDAPADAFEISGWLGYNARFNGQYTPTGETRGSAGRRPLRLASSRHVHARAGAAA